MSKISGRPHRCFVLMVALCALYSEHLWATENHAKQVCQRVKVCASDALVDQQIPDQARELFLTQLNQQCLQSFAEIQRELAEAGLEEQASACADDVIAMPCATLLAAGGAGPKSSKACQTLEAASKQ